jgi:PEGA domain
MLDSRSAASQTAIPGTVGSWRATVAKKEGMMFSGKTIQFLILALVLAPRFLAPANVRGQQNQVMGELQFSGVTKVEKNSGVWIDGQYVGYLKELKGNKKIMLLPGEHEVSVRQAGFQDFTSKIIVEPAQVKLFHVTMEKDLKAQYPGSDAASLKLHVIPERAAVFLDDGYVGHASDFGGAFHSMLVSPGRHRVKIELPGYRTFETEINLLARQKSEVKTELVKGSIQEAGPLVKQP